MKSGNRLLHKEGRHINCTRVTPLRSAPLTLLPTVCLCAPLSPLTAVRTGPRSRHCSQGRRSQQHCTREAAPHTGRLGRALPLQGPNASSKQECRHVSPYPRERRGFHSNHPGTTDRLGTHRRSQMPRRHVAHRPASTAAEEATPSQGTPSTSYLSPLTC